MIYQLPKDVLYGILRYFTFHEIRSLIQVNKFSNKRILKYFARVVSFSKNAKDNDMKNLFQSLGICFYFGFGTPRNKLLALRIFGDLVANGIPSVAEIPNYPFKIKDKAGYMRIHNKTVEVSSSSSIFHAILVSKESAIPNTAVPSEIPWYSFGIGQEKYMPTSMREHYLFTIDMCGQVAATNIFTGENLIPKGIKYFNTRKIHYLPNQKMVAIAHGLGEISLFDPLNPERILLKCKIRGQTISHLSHYYEKTTDALYLIACGVKGKLFIWKIDSFPSEGSALVVDLNESQVLPITSPVENTEIKAMESNHNSSIIYFGLNKSPNNEIVEWDFLTGTETCRFPVNGDIKKILLHPTNHHLVVAGAHQLQIYLTNRIDELGYKVLERIIPFSGLFSCMSFMRKGNSWLLHDDSEEQETYLNKVLISSMHSKIQEICLDSGKINAFEICGKSVAQIIPLDEKTMILTGVDSFASFQTSPSF
jgi:WD40 repeat protein